MTVQEVQFQAGESEEARLRKLRVLVEELVRISRRSGNNGSVFILDVATGTVKQAVLGAPDSGGAGFKVLRIPN